MCLTHCWWRGVYYHPSLSAHGDQLLPLATCQLMGKNEENDVSSIFSRFAHCWWRGAYDHCKFITECPWIPIVVTSNKQINWWWRFGHILRHFYVGGKTSADEPTKWNSSLIDILIVYLFIFTCLIYVSIVNCPAFQVKIFWAIIRVLTASKNAELSYMENNL